MTTASVPDAHEDRIVCDAGMIVGYFSADLLRAAASAASTSPEFGPSEGQAWVVKCTRESDHPGPHGGPSGLPANPDALIHWYEGDRRQFNGPIPGRCDHPAPEPSNRARLVRCHLPAGHPGSHVG